MKTPTPHNEKSKTGPKPRPFPQTGKDRPPVAIRWKRLRHPPFSSGCDRNIDGVLRDGTGQLPAKCLRLVFVCYLLFDARKIAVRHLWVMRSVPIVFAPLLCFQALTPKTIFWCPDCLDSLFVRYVAGRNMVRRVHPPGRTPTSRAGSFHLVRAVSSAPPKTLSFRVRPGGRGICIFSSSCSPQCTRAIGL